MRVTLEDFINGFMGSYADNFSRAGRVALFEYYEQIEDDLGYELEYDPVAICCEWSEYESEEEAKKDLLGEYDQDGDLSDRTTVIHTENSVLVQAF